ncbi:FAD-dependent monooxygenase [Streptomyces sp. NPDC005151]
MDNVGPAYTGVDPAHSGRRARGCISPYAGGSAGRTPLAGAADVVLAYARGGRLYRLQLGRVRQWCSGSSSCRRVAPKGVTKNRPTGIFLFVIHTTGRCGQLRVSWAERVFTVHSHCTVSLGSVFSSPIAAWFGALTAQSGKRGRPGIVGDLQAQVVVVGGGPVGLLLACELAGYGVRTLVVEAETGVSGRPKATTLHARTVQSWSGVVISAGSPAQGSRRAPP